VRERLSRDAPIGVAKLNQAMAGLANRARPGFVDPARAALASLDARSPRQGGGLVREKLLTASGLLAGCLLACAVLAGGTAAAQMPQTANGSPAGDPSPRGGPVLRLRVGPAYLSSTIGFGETADRIYSGAGFAFDAELGGNVASNVALCAEVSGALAPGLSAGGATSDLSTAGIGPSITYSFDPGNVYLATNPALTIVRISSPDHFVLARNTGSNYFGVGIGFVVGGQWRVSSGWRLGAAAEARYAALTGVGDISTMSAYALFFSATHD